MKKPKTWDYCGRQVRYVTDIPELLEWWAYDKNEGVDPHTVTLKATRKFHWRCPVCKHTTISSPEWKWHPDGIGKCRSCMGLTLCNHDRHNSFGELHPDLVKYWLVEKNDKKYWFKCKYCGREYKVAVRCFLKSVGCEKCSSVMRSSFGERYLFYMISRAFPDTISNDRNFLGNGREIDILIPSKRIAIEYDGIVYHSNDIEVRKMKFDRCHDLGYSLVRVLEDPLGKYQDSSGVADFVYASRGTRDLPGLDAVGKSVMGLLGAEDKFISAVDSYEDIIQDIIAWRRTMTVAADSKIMQMWDYERNTMRPELIPICTMGIRIWVKCPRCGRPWHVLPHNIYLSEGCKKCDPSKIGEVEQWDYDGKNLIKVWNSARDASDNIGCNYSLICRVVSGKYKHAYGFQWRKHEN